MSSDDRAMLDACFLGPYGENDTLLEKLVVEFLRDHVYWRRNFHPEDPPAIATSAAREPGYLELEARMRRELHQLSAALKRSVPFHSPRYIGHMASDLLLPGLAAQMLTLPYNPNNVSDASAPVTVDLEIEAGLQLARMVGYRHDPAQPDCAFGHLTSGGTLANFQALRLALALKAFPVALRAARVPGLDAGDDDRAAFATTPARAIELLVAWRALLAAMPDAERAHWLAAVAAERLESLGMVDFFARHPTLAPPRVLAPVTAHYSWSKGMKLLGLGRDRLELVPQREMRLDPGALGEALARCAQRDEPVLMVVAVLGSTEYGSIDPVDAVVDLRDRFAARGLGFAVHVDAAWGGYAASLFRDPDGAMRARDAVAAEFRDFPKPEVHAAFAALGRSDSITIDPHKLGYLPYGAGAFVARDHRGMALLAEDADYVFTPGGPAGDFVARHRQLGRFVIEGSKSGANAAAACIAHRVLPLDARHFGRIQARTILATEAFTSAASRFAVRVRDRATVLVPFAPDFNLVCLAVNPAGNRDPARADAFACALHAALGADARRPLQVKEFLGSSTVLHREAAGDAAFDRILEALGLESGARASRLTLLRHTLMNPYLIDEENGISWVERYFEWLEQAIDLLLVAPAAA
ncbi:MAG TPA: pyridoxal-dependent decarboxylase [Xanthomonadales bacterium]|nr:pyridoxal-dependent decarboxylase [Xanthomonadales bacterium]